MKNAQKIQCWTTGSKSTWVSRRMSNVCPPWKYKTRIAIKSRTLPTSVYRKNFTAAYSRFGPPQTPMIRYIGISMISQNT